MDPQESPAEFLSALQDLMRDMPALPTLSKGDRTRQVAWAFDCRNSKATELRKVLGMPLGAELKLLLLAAHIPAPAAPVPTICLDSYQARVATEPKPLLVKRYDGKQVSLRIPSIVRGSERHQLHALERELHHGSFFDTARSLAQLTMRPALFEQQWAGVRNWWDRFVRLQHEDTRESASVVGLGVPRASHYQHRIAYDQLVSAVDRAQAGSVVIAGPPGCGKTQLAASFFENSTVGIKVWATGTDEHSVIQALAIAAQKHKVPRSSAGTAQDQAEAFNSWLVENKRAALIVVDGLTDFDYLPHLLRRPTHACTVLITTQLRASITRGEGRRVLQVEGFTEAEAVLYITSRLQELVGLGQVSPHAAERAAELAAELSYLPLALAQAVSVLIDEGVTVHQFLAKYQSRTVSLSQLLPEDADRDGYTTTLFGTTVLAINRAIHADGTQLVHSVLSLLAMYSAEGVPLEAFTSETARRWCAGDTPEHQDSVSFEDVHQVLKHLHGLCLINREFRQGLASPVVRMHKVTQRIVAEALNIDTSKTALAAADALASIWPSDATSSEHLALLRRNVMELETHGIGSLSTVEGAVHQISLLLRDPKSGAGSPQAGIRWCDELLSAITALPWDSSVAELRLQRALWVFQAGQSRRAWEALEQLSRHTTQKLGFAHPVTLSVQAEKFHIAAQLPDQSSVAEQVEQLIRQLDETDEPIETEPALRLRSVHAGAVGRAGMVGETPKTSAVQRALHLVEELLPSYIRILGPHHPDTLLTRGNLAVWRFEAGEEQRSLDELADLIDDVCALYGEDHPHTLTHRFNHAARLSRAGRHLDALQAYTDLAKDYERVCGSFHVHTLGVRANRAELLITCDEEEEGRSELGRVLTEQRRHLEPDHPLLVATTATAQRLGVAN